MIRSERGGNALTPPVLAGSPADRRILGRAGWVLRPLKIFGRPRDHPRSENRRRRASGGDVGPKVVRFSTQVRQGFLQRGVSPRIGGDRPPVTLAPGEAHPVPPGETKTHPS